jgi:hypothetical protein
MAIYPRPPASLAGRSLSFVSGSKLIHLPHKAAWVLGLFSPILLAYKLIHLPDEQAGV